MFTLSASPALPDSLNILISINNYHHADTRTTALIEFLRNTSGFHCRPPRPPKPPSPAPPRPSEGPPRTIENRAPSLLASRFALPSPPSPPPQTAEGAWRAACDVLPPPRLIGVGLLTLTVFFTNAGAACGLPSLLWWPFRCIPHRHAHRCL